MSIFEKYPNLEELIKNSDDEDYIFDSLAKLFQEFLNNYSNNFSQEKIKQFCLDSKKLFILNNIFWKKGLQEIKDSDEEVNTPNSKEKLEKIKKVISDTDILVNQFPEDDYISKKSDSEIVEYFNVIENKVKVLTSDIISFYEEIAQDAIELNNSMSKLNETLANVTIKLKCVEITSEFSNKLKLIENSLKDETNIKEFLKNYNWFLNNKLELDELISEEDTNDSNALLILDSLSKVIKIYEPYVNHINDLFTKATV